MDVAMVAFLNLFKAMLQWLANLVIKIACLKL